MKKYGVVLVLREGITQAEAEALVAALAKRGIIDVPESSRVHEFNPEHGGPVWYIP